MRRELKDECDYVREAKCAERFREVLKDDGDFKVPRVVGELSSGRVLVMERMMGEPLTKAAKYPQELRDQVGFLSFADRVTSSLIRSCLVFRSEGISSNCVYESSSISDSCRPIPTGPTSSGTQKPSR